MGNTVIDDVSPGLAGTSPVAPAIVDYPPGYQTYPPVGEAPQPPFPPSPPATTRPRRSPWRFLLVPLVLLLAVGGGIGGGMIGARLTTTTTTTTTGGVALSASVTDLQQAVENVSQGVQPSVVAVYSRGVSSAAVGSGVILTATGYIATNAHVVSGYTDYTVTLSNGTELQARLIGTATQYDLAVIKVTASGLKPVMFADSSAVKVGQFVVALGTPVGFENSASFGIVSALNRTVSEEEGVTGELSGMIQTNATLNPGNSGGALLDLQGRMIGMPTLGVTTSSSGEDVDGLGFAIPSNQVKSVTTQIIQSGSVLSGG